MGRGHMLEVVAVIILDMVVVVAVEVVGEKMMTGEGSMMIGEDSMMTGDITIIIVRFKNIIL
jgi:hypothetical protein